MNRQLVEERYEHGLTREEIIKARAEDRDVERFAVPGAHKRPPRDQVGD